MDTQHLKAFTAVAELRSFSDAAQTLHLTQPAVSKRIAALESQLNNKLFDRIGRQVALTEAGKALLPMAKNILNTVDDTEKAIHNLTGVVSGKLRLATSHHIGLHHLPAVLRGFTQRYPDVSLDLEFMDSEQAYEAVHRGDMELAIATLSDQHPYPMTAKLIWPDPLAFVASNKHPLSQLSKPTLQDLSQYPAILPKPNTHTTALIEQIFDAQKLPLSMTMPTNYLETIKMMVSIGLGWGVIPKTMLDNQLLAFDIENIQLERKLGCIYHPQRTLSNVSKAFLEQLNQKR